jgi:LmbE family N-acetylglucosaminyl deacetylase
MPSPKVLVLSPHPDDAAYSIGGLIQQSTFTFQIHLLTVFGRSNYLRKSKFERDWHLVTRVRKREDFAFAARIGAELTYLNSPEVSLRVGSSLDQIFIHNGNTAISVPRELKSKVRKVVDLVKPIAFFCPLGFGGHRDHLITRKLAATEAASRNIPLFYYEDLPYVGASTEREVLKFVNSVAQDLRARLAPINIESKLNNLTLYRSQIGSEEMATVARYANRVGGLQAAERVWSAAHEMIW